MTLEEALNAARQDCSVMERCGGTYTPTAIWRMLDAIERAAAPFTAMLSESDAMLRSGRGVDFFRSRFGAWERQGLAEKRGRLRYYRAIVIPVRDRSAA